MKIIENKKNKINLEVAYEEFIQEGNSETILILHGWWGSSQSWLEFWEIMSSNWFNVIIPDLPGFWNTKLNKEFNLDDYSQVIEDFVKEKWLEDFILMWHSNGWAISINLIKRWNLKIKKLVLNNSAWIRNDRNRSFKRKILNNVVKIFKIFKKLPWFNKLRNLFYRAIWSHDYLEAEKNPHLKKTYLNMISSDLREEIKNIDIDTLLIRWELDNYTPVRDAYFMRDNIKKSKLCVLTWETHWIHLKNPKRLIETFLNNI